MKYSIFFVYFVHNKTKEKQKKKKSLKSPIFIHTHCPIEFIT